MRKDIDTLYFESYLMKRGVFPELIDIARKHRIKRYVGSNCKYLDQFVARSEKKNSKEKTY